VFQVDTEESITKDEVIDEIYHFLNGTIEKYMKRAEENDACRVYIKDMYYIPKSCSLCPFIQLGKDAYMYRCKLGAAFPYNFKYKEQRAEDCRLVQKGD
jgi:hypothetical protein